MWIGSGLDGIDGLDAGDPVTAEQMRALFGRGAPAGRAAASSSWTDRDRPTRDFQEAMRLGAPFKIVDRVSPFRVEVAKRIAAHQRDNRRPADASIAAADRARVRTEVAREFFRAEHGREPVDARELAGDRSRKTRGRAPRRSPA